MIKINYNDNSNLVITEVFTCDTEIYDTLILIK